jgi:hypothetical protein
MKQKRSGAKASKSNRSCSLRMSARSTAIAIGPARQVATEDVEGILQALRMTMTMAVVLEATAHVVTTTVGVHHLVITMTGTAAHPLVADSVAHPMTMERHPVAIQRIRMTPEALLLLAVAELRTTMHT